MDAADANDERGFKTCLQAFDLSRDPFMLEVAETFLKGIERKIEACDNMPEREAKYVQQLTAYKAEIAKRKNPK
jgi:hypothetical protein